MRIRVTDQDLGRMSADLACCFAYEGDRAPRGVRDAALRRLLAGRMKAEKFDAHAGDMLTWNAGTGTSSKRYLVIGLGADTDVHGERLRTGCARAARAAADVAAKSLAVLLPFDGAKDVTDTAVRAATEGLRFGGYRFDTYLTDPGRRREPVARVELGAGTATARLRSAVKAGEAVGDAVALARDLVNEPPSRLTPTEMARRARAAARRHGLRCTVLGKPQIEAQKLGAFLAVARGSAEAPRLVHLVYRPEGKKRTPVRRVLLVGKGVTFDSGGLNLKPGSSMATMKCDMGGAAAVLATMTALHALDCRVEVHALLGLTENMTGAAAYKPGDILETWSGTTVEVGNTDAEGRLVLCDVLAWGIKKVKPTEVVDVATLTGACVVALGLRATGLFTRHDELGDGILEASGKAGEKFWPMPMYDEYLQSMQKGPADLNNIGERWGGAITAALFLGEFVPRDLPWAHLDIAGPAFTERDLPDALTGGTGAAVPTLLRWLEDG